MNDADTPVLLYDGACDFCAWWVRYWQRLCRDRVRFRPYQESLADYPDLDAETCRRAIQWRTPNGEQASAAATACAVLAAAGRPLWNTLYRRSRRVAACAEAVYRHIAARREAAATVSRALWGSERYPAEYSRAAGLFVKFIGALYICAFASLAVQVEGLLGSHGVLPAAAYLDAAQQALGDAAYWRLPSLLWLNASDPMLVGLCLFGIGAGALAVAGRAPAFTLLTCYLVYLSLVSVGQDFMRFQWDMLLLEAGFLAIFLPWRSHLVTFLFRLLLFRFMFLSGCVKLLSGDPSWAALSALDVHFETQPLPTPLAWYAHHLPGWIRHAGVVATLVVELALPFLIFAPRRPRMLAACGFVALECVIALTGNYNFFNLLTIALVVFLFDDAQLGGRVPAARESGSSFEQRARVLTVAVLTTVVVGLNAYYLARPWLGPRLPQWSHAVAEGLQPWRVVNPYGLFAVMTTQRAEIEIEASNDGRTWQAYTFRYKPGPITRAPTWILPHQPRLDWQMWFAALSSAEHTPWLGNLMYRLLQAEPKVLDLLESAPFGASRPRYVRAVLYDYRFTTPAQRHAGAGIWRREQLGRYFPEVGIR